MLAYHVQYSIHMEDTMNTKLAKLIRIERLRYEQTTKLQTWKSVVKHVRAIHRTDRAIAAGAQ